MFFRRRASGGYIPPTPTTPRYWVGGTGTWDQSATTHWATSTGGAGGASVPTALNDVIFDASSGTGTCTCNANAPCNSLTSTASNISLTHNASVTISIGSSHNAGPGNVALDLSGLVAYTKGGGTSTVFAFVSTIPTQQTVNYSTFAISTQTFNGAGGSWQYASNVTGSGVLTLTTGSLDTNNKTISVLACVCSGSVTRSLTLGTSSLTVTGGGAGQFDTTGSGSTVAAGMTLSAASSTIIVSGAAGGFRGGGLTYGTVNLTGSGTSVVTGANSYVNFTRSNAAACALTLPSAVTQTITNAPTLSGTAGNLLTLNASTGTSAALISAPSASCDYMSITDSTITGAGPFHAGSHSTLVSNTTGWVVP